LCEKIEEKSLVVLLWIEVLRVLQKNFLNFFPFKVDFFFVELSLYFESRAVNCTFLVLWPVAIESHIRQKRNVVFPVRVLTFEVLVKEEDCENELLLVLVFLK